MQINSPGTLMNWRYCWKRKETVLRLWSFLFLLMDVTIALRLMEHRFLWMILLHSLMGTIVMKWKKNQNYFFFSHVEVCSIKLSLFKIYLQHFPSIFFFLAKNPNQQNPSRLNNYFDTEHSQENDFEILSLREHPKQHIYIFFSTIEGLNSKIIF